MRARNRGIIPQLSRHDTRVTRQAEGRARLVR